MELNPAQKAEHRFLVSQVDKHINENNRTDRHPNVEQDLFRARSELNMFVRSLRVKGYSI
tara:strand:- start:857 stop:1036 length:180 start_codon:yes stop_codon:yes gene_type:complete